jgi:hypothetical protein
MKLFLKALCWNVGQPANVGQVSKNTFFWKFETTFFRLRYVGRLEQEKRDNNKVSNGKEGAKNWLVNIGTACV